MDPFESLKYQEPLAALKARIEKEGSNAVFSLLIEKYILNNPQLVTIEIQVLFDFGFKVLFLFNYKTCRQLSVFQDFLI